MRARALAAGYRSGFEERLAKESADKGHKVQFEAFKIEYKVPAKVALYTPDFPLENDVIIESKGRFTSADRQKHKHIKATHPDLDIRFVFANPKTKLSKRSPTTYADWCDKHGFLYAAKSIPDAWFAESPCPKRSAALAKAKR